MKSTHHKIYTLALAAGLLFSLATCKKGYLDVNQTNPNLTEHPPINGLLAGVTYKSAVNVFSAGNITSYYVQQLASPNTGSGSDIYDDVDRSTTWRYIYLNVTDIRQMKKLALQRKAYEHLGVADILEAFNMSMLTDLFGDAPYREAWSEGENLKPGYDSAKAIYDSCLSLIDQGVAALNLPDPQVTLDASNDLIHGGNKAAWVKTAYALKARLLNRMSKQANYDPAAILAALGNAYASNADDAQVTRFESLSLWNGVAKNNASGTLDGWLSANFVNALNGTTYGVFDPRLPLITDTTRFGDYRGTANGVGRTGSGTDNSACALSPNGYYSRGGAPLLMLTYAEMKFIEAEASFGSDKARSYQAYLDGIAANMDKVGVAAARKQAYLTNPVVAVGVAAFTKDLIFKEKYVATFLQPETWTDARRFDYKYKDFNLPRNALLNTFVRRVGYPTSETSRNAENVPAVGSLADHLWWDK
ncbi:SusD/RagB family nutrient-binding outer membrane lipoprotein [Chitinophaga ginsengisoli]|uniref:SusD-like starch-binding protein associating with outer membrane n=1 Tax=Chitinophaga ginsengisoli TaxID=363837 RepID=A0A2P8FGP0_9BACT|nr:SusD/RagB family nutrient-binding outer membrane lipoprotein [Chitinophaga ginsengisoli]PSL20867.1 SusD-like starch-binding protein associating with outer membrane [Chitinophaga ginsengisoli]